MSEKKEARPETFPDRISAVMREVGPLVIDSRNQRQKYNYTSAARAIGKIQGAMASYGLFVQSAESELVEWREMKTQGGSWDVAIIKQSICISDGEHSISASAYGSGADAGDKHLSKAETQAFKYALCKALVAALNAGPEEDEETDRHAAGKAEDEGVEKKAREWMQREAHKAETLDRLSELATAAQRAPKSVQAELMEMVESARKRIEEQAA